MADLRVAVVGATGLVGRTVLRVLEERRFPVGEIVPLASERSAGSRVRFQDHEVEVQRLDGDSFKGCSLAFFSAGATVSRAYAPIAAEAGALVVDNSSAFRMQPDIPLVVPEVNGDVLPPGLEPGIIANPNCSTIGLVVALQPLHRAFGLQEVIVSTYQSVSGSGGKGVQALNAEIERGELSDASPYAHPIAFNVLPHIDTFDDLGWTGEERKMMNETRKIMRLPRLHIVPTTVRVPVRVGHGESIYARFATPVPAREAREALSRAPGIVMCDDPSRNLYPLPRDVEGRDEVFVGRVRSDPDDPTALAFWVVSDNIRKGAATNAVQIAERVVAGHIWSRSSSDTVPSSP